MVTLLNTVEDPIARAICGGHGDKPEELLEILHAVQHENGFLSDGALRTIAHSLNLSRAEVHGVVSFYHDYKREKQARQTIKICRAEACQALGADDLIADAEKAFDVKLDKGGSDVGLEAAYCLGNCALSPAVMIESNLYGRVDIVKLKKLSLKHREGSQKQGAMS